jgi:hypothetical protein
MPGGERFSINGADWYRIRKFGPGKEIVLNILGMPIRRPVHFNPPVPPRRKGVRSGAPHPNPPSEARTNQQRERSTGVLRNQPPPGREHPTENTQALRPKDQAREKAPPSERKISPISDPGPHHLHQWGRPDHHPIPAPRPGNIIPPDIRHLQPGSTAEQKVP